MTTIKKRTCPHCGRDEMFDATTTTEHPELFEQYPAFRGNEKKRVWLCYACKGMETVEDKTPDLQAKHEQQTCPECGSANRGLRLRLGGELNPVCMHKWHRG